MNFPTRQGDIWNPPALFLSKLYQVYGTDFVIAESEKAAVWLWANKRRQKTERGMPRFLNGWLAKAHKDAAKRPKQVGVYVGPSAIPDDEVERVRRKLGLCPLEVAL
jgi:hypothetical protein